MKLSEFRSRIKLELPNIGQTAGVKDPQINALINQACDYVNLFVKAHKGYTDFDAVQDKKTYSIAEVAPRYAGRDSRGVFFKNSSGIWSKLIGRSEPYISENLQNFLNSSSVEIPQFYFINGDTFGFEPSPSSTISGGVRLYHLLKATPMVNDDHYPFSGSTVEISALQPLDEPIIEWVKWKIEKGYGTVTDIDLKERAFLNALASAERFVNRIPDVSISSSYGMRT